MSSENLKSHFEHGRFRLDRELQVWRRSMLFKGYTPDRFSDEIIQQITSGVLQPWSSRILQSLESNPQRTRERLRVLASRYPEEGFTVPSQANLCARVVIGDICFPKFQEAARHHNRKRYLSFITAYDVADGLRHAVSAVFVAERELAGSTDQDAVAAHQELASMSFPEPSIIEEAKGYLIYHQMARQFADLFQQDPTGQLLIAEKVRQIEQEASNPALARERGEAGWIDPDQIPALMVFGAQLGKQVYEVLYLLTQ